MPAPAIELRDVSRRFGRARRLFGGRAQPVRAVRRVSLSVPAGATLGLAGESGSGKSTVARLVAGLLPPTSGTIRVAGHDLGGLARGERRALNRRVQLVFQDPAGSLNPRRTVRAALEAPLRALLRLPAAERRARLDALLESVQLDRRLLGRYPHELSGGQAQRVAIARALAVEPDILLLDEPTSALDVSVQAEILRMLRRLREARGLTLLFISHDLAVIEAVCERVAIMRRGRIVEEGDAAALFRRPQKKYTRRLLASIPTPGRRTIVGRPTEQTAG